MASQVSLKSLSPFAGLTAAEAAVFERDAKVGEFAAGQAILLDEVLWVIDEGKGRWGVPSDGGGLTLGSLGSGELLGEMSLFEPDPVALMAEAEDDTRCLGWQLPALKNAFRYSRTGAVKFMGIFARSLSAKIRVANQLLRDTQHSKDMASKSKPPADERPPSALGEQDLARLKSLTTKRHYDQDTVIFQEGEESRELFVISDGQVDILKKVAPEEELPLARLGVGDFFGEMAFVDKDPRSATALAKSSLEVQVLPADAMETVVEYNLGTALYLTNVICKIVARRLNQTLRRVLSAS